MRSVPSRLLFAALTLFLIGFAPHGALAQSGWRHGFSGHHRSWGGHSSFKRWHWSGPRHGFSHRGFAARWPHKAWPHAGFGVHGFRRPAFFYPGYGRFGYGYHGYGRHYYGRSGYGPHGYGRRGYGFFPHTSWLEPSERFADTVIVAEPRPAGSDPGLVPSVADLPTSLGIRSAPVAAPAIVTVSSGARSLTAGGAKVVALNGGVPDQAVTGPGPRIIRLGASR
jgi:hypothetical protein